MLKFKVEFKLDGRWIDISTDRDLKRGIKSIAYNSDTRVLCIYTDLKDSRDLSFIKPIPESHALVNGETPSAVWVL